MRTGPIVGGIILLIMGTGGYLFLHNYPSEAKTLLGQLARSMIPNLRHPYLQILMYKVGSAVIAAIGLAVLIYGAVAKNTSRKSQVQQRDGPATWSPTSNKIFCRYCGRIRLITGALCPQCGKPTQSTYSLTKKCVKCQITMTEDSQFCLSCGKNLG